MGVTADVAKGERFQKDIYEALRAGPGWGKTLFLIVYDDSGGQCTWTRMFIAIPFVLPAPATAPAPVCSFERFRAVSVFCG